MSFIGSYADLTNFVVGNFLVIQLTGRDRTKAPLWCVRCKRCGREQAFAHAKLTNRLEARSATETLFCQNQACPLSRKEQSRTETLRDVRRAEIEERLQAERVEHENRELAVTHSADRTARELALAPLRADWHRYVVNRINVGIPANRILNFDRWQQIGDSARNRLLELVSGNERELGE